VYISFQDQSIYTTQSTQTTSDGSYSLQVYRGVYNVQLSSNNVSYTAMTGLTVGGNMTQNFSWYMTAQITSLSVTTAGNGTGMVTGAGLYNYGDTATVAASAYPGSTFTGWSGDCTGTISPKTVLMNGNKTCTAIFAANIVPTAPTVTGISPTRNTKPTWRWISGGGVGTYRYKLDNSDLNTGATLTISKSYSPETDLIEAVHTLYVQEQDASGNWSLSGSFSITVYIGAVGALPQTGQTSCYDSSGVVISCDNTGQDGELLSGVAWPSPRFTNADNTTPITGSVVLDQLTGLMWTQDGNAPGPVACSPGTTKTWQGALDYVACLNTNNYLGHSDWRLPNRNELKSLINNGQSSPATWLNAQGFTNAQANSYWSSTSYMFGAIYAWHVSMYEGGEDINFKTSSSYVWPVRAGQCGAFGTSGICLPKTGQTTVYSTGDDGSLQTGVTWPQPRFSLVSSGTGTAVADALTGLMWTQDGGTPSVGSCTGGAMTWQAALNYVTCFNTNNYLGYTDWRVPNVNELISIVNIGQWSTATWLNSLGFVNALADIYWSSTSYTGVAGAFAGGAWYVNMDGGYVNGYYGKANNSYYVWPVRGGLAGSLNQYTITATAGTGGSINPSSRLVSHGTMTTFTVTPNAGYTASVDGTCGGTLNGTTYTTNTITGPCTVAATFSPNPINGACGSSDVGTFTAAPTTNLCSAGNQTVISGTGPWTWQCTGLNGGTSAMCLAYIQKYTVTGQANAGGLISPISAVVSHGSTTSFTFTLNTGFHIASVTGCGGTLFGNTYTTGAITGDCMVTATFAKISTEPILWYNTGSGMVYAMTTDGAAVTGGSVIWTEPDNAWTIVNKGDFNGDGVRDYVWRNSITGQVYLMFMANATTVGSGAVVWAEPDPNWKIVASGDLNGDGKTDLIWWNSTTGQVFAMLMNGASTPTGAVIWTEPNTDWKIVAAADLNNDTKADLIWWNSTTGQVFGMLMDGTTVSSSNIIWTEPDVVNWRIVGAGDINGDGKADLIWRNRSTGMVFAMLMNGTAVSNSAVVWTEPDMNWDIVSIDYYNNDSNADLLWRNKTTGMVYLIPMNGLAAPSGGSVLWTEPDMTWRIMGDTEWRNNTYGEGVTTATH
jgi:uncharacterized repeat protein (TIGR02543 family)